MIMKKYFIFAALVTAGLLTSCSSSDDAISENPNSPIENQGDRTPIKVDVGSPVANLTRGTGTVGSVAGSAVANAWHGQVINVFMFDKGTLNLTPGDVTDPNSPALYNNEPMYTPGTDKNLVTGMQTPAASGEAMITDGTINYYPINGNFDFFGYHGDDAIDGNATITRLGANDAVITPAADPAQETYDNDVKWTLPFEIDGTQDLMSTKAALTDAQATAMGVNEQTPGPRANDYYSAYSARKSTPVQPVLTFKHLLSRLSFVAVAGNDKAAGCEVGAPTVTEITAGTYDGLDAAGKAQCVIKDYAPKAGNDGKLTDSEFSGLGDQTNWDATMDNAHEWTGTNPLPKADYDLLTAAERDKFEVANYTRTQPGVATVTAANAVKINSIEVYSRTTGNLVVAWKGDLTEAQKISFTAADEQFTQTSVDGTDAKWLTLQERPTWKKTTPAAAIEDADIEGSGSMTAAELADAKALAKLTISDYVYNNVLSNTGQGKYEAITDPYQENLTTLTPTSPQIDTNETGADRYPETQIGEALIVAPSANNYIMKVNLSQRVKSNWNPTPTGTFEEKTQTAFFTIDAPQNDGLFTGATEGFLQNVSYKIKLTVYGWERIIVTAVVEPWIQGETIPVGQD